MMEMSYTKASKALYALTLGWLWKVAYQLYTQRRRLPLPSCTSSPLTYLTRPYIPRQYYARAADAVASAVPAESHGSGMDITFTATASASGSLLVGSSREDGVMDNTPSEQARVGC
jgi:hypothetical protein